MTATFFVKTQSKYILPMKKRNKRKLFSLEASLSFEVDVKIRLEDSNERGGVSNEENMHK